MIVVNPECADEKLTPCSSENWVQCDRCYKLICDIHDEVVQVWHLNAGEFGRSDRLCRPCVEFGRYLGESFLSHNEYVNH
jgi:hypothetical protein